MTEQQKQKIEEHIRRSPLKSDSSIAKNFSGMRAGDVRKVRESMAGKPETTKPETEETEHSGKIAGISLANRSVLSRRPAESAAKFIRKLPNGKAYAPSDLSRAWGMSEETIRKHARDLGCLKFVEVDQDDWKPMILNPDTAKNYHL